MSHLETSLKYTILNDYLLREAPAHEMTLKQLGIEK